MSLVGSYVALSKSLTLIFPVFLLAWLRFGIGGLAMLHWFKKPPQEQPLTAATKRLIFLESLLGNFLFSIFSFQTLGTPPQKKPLTQPCAVALSRPSRPGESDLLSLAVPT